MKKTKNILVTIVMVAVMFTQGCVSYMAYQSNEEEAYAEEVYRSGDPALVEAFEMNGTRGVAIDVTAADVIFRSPGAFFKQLGAALLDGAIIYGLNEAVDSINSSDSSRRDTTSLNITGSGNSVSVRGDQDTTTTTTQSTNNENQNRDSVTNN